MYPCIQDFSAFKDVVKSAKFKDETLKSDGITFKVYDSDEKTLGKLILGEGKIKWRGPHVRVGNEVERSWAELIEWFNRE